MQWDKAVEIVLREYTSMGQPFANNSLHKGIYYVGYIKPGESSWTITGQGNSFEEAFEKAGVPIT